MGAPMAGSGDFVVRPCTPADRGALLALCRRTFGGRLDETSCAARLDGGPVAATQVVGAFGADGRCVGMFPSIPLPFRIHGQDQLVHQGALVAIDPEFASGLVGGRLLHRLSRTCFDPVERQGGRFVFGCPEAGLRRVLTGHGGTEVVWDVVPLVRAAGGTRTRGDGVHVASVPPDDVDALWRRIGANATTGVVRDRRYLAWRYGEQRGCYRFHSVRDAAGSLRGLAVVRDGGWAPRTLTILEWLVPRGDGAAEPLLDQALHEAAAGRCEGVVTWFAPATPEYDRFQTQFGFACRATGHQMCVRPLGGFDRDSLCATWYQSAGDLEFL